MGAGGSDAYLMITTALRERLAQVEPQQAQAASTDLPRDHAGAPDHTGAPDRT